MILNYFLLSFILREGLSESLNVYGSVPGLDPSNYYKIQVKKSTDDEWIETFTMTSECTTMTNCDQTPGIGIWKHLANWTNAYINFEMAEDTEVEVKITKLWGDPLNKAVVHPAAAATSCQIVNGEAVVTINKPGLFTVDINGQMDDQDTGMLPHNRGYYDGPPIHTVTIFANPFLANKPNLEDEGVYSVAPGETPPEEGNWHTLYFLPGLHDIGQSFTVHQNKSYYIPGDAVVYGTMNNHNFEAGQNVTIFGHGTLSGDRLPHPSMTDLPEEEHWRHG